MSEGRHNLAPDVAPPPLRGVIGLLVAVLFVAGFGLCLAVNHTLRDLRQERVPGAARVAVAELPALASEASASAIVAGERDGWFVPKTTIAEPTRAALGQWYRFDFENPEPVARRGALDLDWRFLDRATLHVVGHDGRVTTMSSGETVPWAERSRPVPLVVFDVELPPQATTRAYLHVVDHHRGPHGFIWWPDARDFDRLERAVLMQWAAFGGLWIGLVAYNLFLFAVLRRRDLADYVLYAALLGATVFLGSNMSTAVVGWPAIPGFPLRETTLAILVAATVWSLGRFTRSFLRTAEDAPTLERSLRWHRWACGAMLALVPMAWLPPPAARHYLVLVSVLSAAVMLDLMRAAWSRWRSGDAHAGLLLLAFVPLVVGFTWTMLGHRQLVLHDRLSGLPLLVGHGLELVLFSLAIAQRHRRAVDERRRLEANYARELESEVGERTAEIRETSARLEEALREKDRVFAIIGHDLRGPTLASRSMASMLAEDAAEMSRDEMADLARRMTRASAAQLELLDNLLMWGRARTGEWHPRPEACAVAAAVAGAVELLEPATRAKEIAWERKIDPTTRVNVDRQVFETVLRNLLGNAVKFSPKGGRVGVEATRDAGAVEIRITDQGAGISPERLAQVFTGRIESTRGTSGEKGTGVGLNLCRDLARASGGELLLESEAGRGTVAVLVLPAE